MCFYKFHDRLLDYNVSPRAMILYAILADRMQLSKKNDNFKDKDGVFIYFTLEKIQEVLHVAYNTAKKLMKELAANHLIRKKRQGQGQPNKIYVYEFEESESQTEQTDKKTSHKTDKKTSHKTDKKTSHKTDKKMSVKTDKKLSVKTDRKLSPNQTNTNQTDISKSSSSEEERTEAESETIQQKIEYHALKSEYPQNSRTLGLIVKLICANAAEYPEINKQIVETVMNNLTHANLKNVRNFYAYAKACISSAYYMPIPAEKQSYAPTYNIAEYESTSVLDEEW